MKNLFHIFIVLHFWMVSLHEATTNITCPTVPQKCDCRHRKQMFIISCSQLETVSFQNLPSDIVVDINLNTNSLKEINASTFPHPNNIRRLLISKNGLQRIGPGTFEGFNGLKKLDLSNNHLVELTNGAFRGLDNTSLTKLDLSGNRILRISSKAFMSIKSKSLDLSGQKDVNGDPADLISYSDFLSWSLVEEISLMNNQMLCDCNMMWLLDWLEVTSHKIGDVTCQFPKPLADIQILELYSQQPSWNCSAHNKDFSLPIFLLSPDNDQILVENDQFEMYCYSTWVERSSITWFHDNIKISKSNGNVKITNFFNLTRGSYSSKLIILNITSASSGTYTCTVKVRHSGSISLSRKVRVLNERKENCHPTTSKTNRGVIRWPTALYGANIQATCPHGSVNNNLAHFTCSNGTWESLKVNGCLFNNEFTRKLQQFSALVQTRSSINIKKMLEMFFKIFPHDYHLIKTKYDLYFLNKMLHEIMNTYKGNDGVLYSKFLWHAVGMIVDNHLNLPAMNKVVYGRTSAWRYRDLIERFVFEQIELKKYKENFHISIYHSMTASSVSRKRNDGDITCYIVPARNMTASCDSTINSTLYRQSSVFISMNFGSNFKFMRVTVVSYKMATFFQNVIKNSTDDRFSILSTIIGLKVHAKYQNGTETTTSGRVQLSFSNDFIKGSDSKLVMWLEKEGESGQGRWVNVTHCVRYSGFIPINGVTRNITQYYCPNLKTPNMTYYALVGKRPPPVTLVASYLEVIVYVMAAVCSIFLIATLIVYGYFAYYRRLLYNRTDSATLMNLCLVLLIAEIFFACGIHQTHDVLICKGVAVALHYLLLCAYVWLGCGGMVLLRLVKKKDRANINEYDPVLKYYLAGWGLPLIICSITLAYDNEAYGTEDYCWLGKKLSIGGFMGPGGIILLADLVVFCYLHSVINRLFPKPLEGEANEDTSDEEQDKNCDKDECHNNKCRYKMQTKKKGTQAKFRFPKRRELISYLFGSLIILLLLSMTFTLTSLIYSYRGAKAVYLYQLFSYGSALSNLLIGLSLFYYHCIKRRDILKGLLLIYHNITRYTRGGYIPENEALVGARLNDEEDSHFAITRVENDEALNKRGQTTRDPIDDTVGVFGLSDAVISDGSNIITTVRVERAKACEGRGESIDGLSEKEEVKERVDVNDTKTKTPPKYSPPLEKRAPISQSELSDQEKFSQTENSIGDCSLVSSKKSKRPPSKIEIPNNLKNFVPENWRPARRRHAKGASYYPYFISENNPISASLAYSSKSSSLASTTVSGVPLYLNNKTRMPTINGMHNQQLKRHGPMPMMQQRPSPLAIRHPVPVARPPLPMVYPNMPVRFPLAAFPPQPQPMVPGVPLMPIQSIPREMTETLQTFDEFTEDEQNFQYQNGDFTTLDNVPLVDESPLTTEEEEEAEELVEELVESEPEPHVPVPPDLYIPMPYVSIKQFILRNETSV